MPSSPFLKFSLLFSLAFLFCSVVDVQSSTGERVSPDYRLAPDDLLDFRVFQEPDLDAVVRISNDGHAIFPLVGSLLISGKTIPEAIGTIETAYRDGYLKKPQVSLTIRAYAKQLFTVLGQVQKPGSYEIDGSKKITLLQAIGMAGGYTNIADPSNITIKREENGTESVIKLNAKRMAREEDNAAFFLKPGDVISVGESLF